MNIARFCGAVLALDIIYQVCRSAIYVLTGTVDSNAEWKKLNTFTRFSNIRSANARIMLTGLVRERYLSGTNEEMKDKVLRIEHRMWCYYHLMCNWQYSKTTDKTRRLHKELVAFDEPSPDEQGKDADMWEYVAGSIKAVR